MQNDPAILIYAKDLLMDLTPMTMQARGQLITLLLLQHQLGHLSLEQIETSVGKTTPALMAHFDCDADGRFFNPRVEEEVLRRSAFREKQRQKARKRWDRPEEPPFPRAFEQPPAPRPSRGLAAAHAEGLPMDTGAGTGAEAGTGAGVGGNSENEKNGEEEAERAAGETAKAQSDGAQGRRAADKVDRPEGAREGGPGHSRPCGERADDSRQSGSDRARQREAFERFWAAYPRKIGRKGAAEAFNKLPEALWPRLTEAVERQKRSEQWRREGGRYIPSPITWLSQERWDDLPEPEPNREALWTVADMVRDIERAFGPIEAAPKPGDSRQQEGCV